MLGKIALSLLFMLPLAAQTQRIVLDPPGPTSATPIEARLYVACDPVSHTVTALGNVIKIHVTPGPIENLCDPPIASLYSVSLGALPAGVYRIDVTVGALDAVTSRTFVVRNAGESVFDVHPFAIPMQPFGLPVRLDAGELEIVRAYVDDVLVTPLTYDGVAYSFPAPAHAPGLARVKIETRFGVMHTLLGALYYYDPTAPPDPSIFERILFPVLFNTAGAHGSQWVSEAAVANPQPWYVETYNDVVPFECIDYPCGERLSPGSFLAFTGAGYPQGVALIAPRAEAADLAFTLRIRDTSRTAEGFGTQVPVVRERDMFRGTDLTLLDIPIDPRYRTKLRMYVFDSGEHDAQVTLDRAGGTQTFNVPVRRTCTDRECHATPWYAELDLPAGAVNEVGNVYVSIGGHESPAWAFASVTNNVTQQVTIVTADGKGGRP
jgi:hypothetical protein